MAVLAGRQTRGRYLWHFFVLSLLVISTLAVSTSAGASEHNLSSRTPVSFTYTFVEQLSPGESWTDEGGGFHLRNAVALGEQSGDLPGSIVVTVNVDNVDISGFVCPPGAGATCSVRLNSVWGSIDVTDEDGGWDGTFIFNDVAAEGVDEAALPVGDFAGTLVRGRGNYSNQSVTAVVTSTAEDLSTIEFSGVRSTLTRPISGQQITAQTCFDESDFAFDGGFLASGLIETSGSVRTLAPVGSGGPWTHQYGIRVLTTLADEHGTLTIELMGSGRDQFTQAGFSAGGWGRFMVVDGTGMYAETYGHGRFLATVGTGAACNGAEHVQLIFLGDMHANTFEPAPMPEPKPQPE